MLYLGLIILLIVAWSQNSNLKQENMNLRMTVYRWQEYYDNYMHDKKKKKKNGYSDQNADYNYGYNNYQANYYQNFNQESNINNNVISEPVKEKIVISDTEKRNIAILITGALFIILSAIVFLMSTWYTIPNILKTVVLVLLTMVFLGGSYIAREKFKLEKTSQTFFYIAMAYIPLCLLSISVFGLFGDYLSIIGDGSFIYLTIVALFISGLYYYIYVSKDNIYLLHGSIIAQMLCVMLFSLIFANNIVLIGINLLLYNIVLIIVTKSDIFNKIYHIVPFVISGLSICCLDETKYLMIVLLGLLVLNFLIFEIKKHDKATSYMLNIMVMALGIYTAFMHVEELNINVCLMSLLGYILSVYSLEILLVDDVRRKDLQDSMDILAVIVVASLHFYSFSIDVFIPSYVVSLVQMVLLTCIYFEPDDVRKAISSILLPLYFIFSGLSFVNDFNLGYNGYAIFALLTFVVGEVLRNREKVLHEASFVISHIFILLTYAFMLITRYDTFVVNVMYSLLLLGVYVYCYFVDKRYGFKYAIYLATNFLILTFIKSVFVDTDLVYLITLFTSLAVMVMEIIYPKLRDNLSDAYIVLSQIVTFGFLYMLNVNASIILVMAYAVLVIAYNFKYKAIMWNVVPLIGVINAIFFSDINLEVSLALMIAFTSITSVASISLRKASVFTIFSGLYLLMLMSNFDNVYISNAFLTLWTLAHALFFCKDLHKDIFKFILYIALLGIYNTAVVDLGLDSVTVIAALGTIVVAAVSFRTIVNKYIPNSEILEYVVFTFLYLIAFSNYANEADGMLFGILMIAILFLSYMFKSGAIFMVTIIGLIVNVLLLTREFWFAVPWWAYLLSIGVVLITFAVRNEIGSKNGKISITGFYQDIKNRIDGDLKEDNKK